MKRFRSLGKQCRKSVEKSLRREHDPNPKPGSEPEEPTQGPCMCSRVDMGLLFRSLPIKPSTNSTQKHEEDRQVEIRMFRIAIEDCKLCKVLAYYLHPSGSFPDCSSGEIWCRLRPKLVWETEAGITLLKFTGSISVNFHNGVNEVAGKSTWSIDNLRRTSISGTVDIVSSSFGYLTPKRLQLLETVDVGLIHEWLQDCDIGSKEHVGNCSGGLLALTCDKSLKAINTTTGQLSSLKPSCRFVALSYVWGPTQQVTKLSTTPKQPLAGQDMASSIGFGIQDYPPTIRDAVMLSKDLGYDWLWVDRICIDQTDEEEKAILIPLMKDIFAAAELTIVAACGGSASSGLAGIGTTRRKAEEPCDLRWKFDAVRLLPGLESFNSYLKDSIWNTRGWTFEECVFSRRLLFVFPTETILSGSGKTYRESLGEAVNTNTAGTTWGDRGGTPPTIVAELHAKFHGSGGMPNYKISAREYVRAVEEYSSRMLTFEEDRIKAFAGLVTTANSGLLKIPEESLLLHGHPLEFFETLLTWHQDDDRVTRAASHDHRFAPSWSWASAGSEVRFIDNGEQRNRSHWFTYCVIDGFDILGVLKDLPIQFFRRLGLRYPHHVVAEKPWEGWIAANRHLYQEEGDTECIKAPRLPILHLVTVVFDAILLRGDDGEQYFNFEWSATNPVKKHQMHTFAFVAGRMHIYIMRLQSESEDGSEQSDFS